MKGGKWGRERGARIWKEEGSSAETRRRQHIVVGLLLVKRGSAEGDRGG